MTTATVDSETQPEWVEDMILLGDLSEESIITNLRKRFQAGHIYTYTGSIVVALNPYQDLDIYGHATIAKYKNRNRSSNSPHIFALADATVSNLRLESKNQSVIISGESGSGKSESTKYILSYLTAVTSQHSSVSWIHQQILEANIVLESFGNAKTSRNNNSSRFGKFIQVQLDSKMHIVGANVTSYLLEKSRVSKQAKNERSYHVFYELLSGANEEEAAKYILQPAANFGYLSQSGCFDIAGVDEKAKFESLKFSLTVLNVTPDETDGILRTLSAVLWLGNVCFKSQSGESVRIDEKEAVKNVASLLGVSETDLVEVLCFKKLVVRNETTMVPLKLPQAMDNRDSISKNIYSYLFKSLLELVNNTLQAGFGVECQNSIGILDIFGFEGTSGNISKYLINTNSFEQFCINYTNEKLQNFFNLFIFKLEQEEYEREGISWEKITYEDNQACLDLIEAKAVGILALLDEELKVPKGSEEAWLLKLEKRHEKQKHFFKPKTKNNIFGVKHYAGDVLYTIDGFLEKNKDALQDELYSLISSSSVPFIASIISAKEDVARSTPGTPKTISRVNSTYGLLVPSNQSSPLPITKPSLAKTMKVTAGSNFKNQLSSLMNTLSQTTTHYVRCIKPNSLMESFKFEDSKVLDQLRYSGMMETIKIRKSGFPARISLEQFNLENRFLLPGCLKITDQKEKAAKIVQFAHIESDMWQIGITKIFMKTDAVCSISTNIKPV
ncbi:cytochrome c oxidase subunit 1 [Entophlyctis luteolus]|nr:cytochrome c oxidase subunit 1 [Entophlyctis luteolus]